METGQERERWSEASSASSSSFFSSFFFTVALTVNKVQKDVWAVKSFV